MLSEADTVEEATGVAQEEGDEEVTEEGALPAEVGVVDPPPPSKEGDRHLEDGAGGEAGFHSGTCDQIRHHHHHDPEHRTCNSNSPHHHQRRLLEGHQNPPSAAAFSTCFERA